jgi:hypothetical protein
MLSDQLPKTGLELAPDQSPHEMRQRMGKPIRLNGGTSQRYPG